MKVYKVLRRSRQKCLESRSLIRVLHTQSMLLWLCVGDFNGILASSRRVRVMETKGPNQSICGSSERTVVFGKSHIQGLDLLGPGAQANANQFKRKQRCFKFDNMWTSYPSCKEVIANS